MRVGVFVLVIYAHVVWYAPATRARAPHGTDSPKRRKRGYSLLSALRFGSQPPFCLKVWLPTTLWGPNKAYNKRCTNDPNPVPLMRDLRLPTPQLATVTTRYAEQLTLRVLVAL